MNRKFASALIAVGLAFGALNAQQADDRLTTSSSVSIATANGSASAGVGVSDNAFNNAGSDFIPQPAAIMAQVAKLQAETTWGLSTIPLPAYLRHPQLGLSPDQGLLVIGVLPGLAAEACGISQGCTIVAVDGQPVLSGQILPILQTEHKLTILNESGVKEVCIKPSSQSFADITNPNLSSVLRQTNIYAQSLPQMSSGFRVPNAVAGGPSPRSLSVSQVNGEMVVSAVLDSASGPTRIELRGSRAEIARQIANLPSEVQLQLTPHLGL